MTGNSADVPVVPLRDTDAHTYLRILKKRRGNDQTIKRTTSQNLIPTHHSISKTYLRPA
jgi:hypothetical protein